MSTIDRRTFLAGAGTTAATLTLVQGLGLRAAAAADHGRPPRDPGYGALAPRRPDFAGPGADPGLAWLAVPPGFRYGVFGLSGSPMSDGHPTPYGHDGMGAFPARHGRVRLVRNHEVRDNAGVTPPPSATNAYDTQAGGGNTTLELSVSRHGVRLHEDFVSLSGTHTNCAGGETPWGSWLSCEEVTVGAANGFAREHGYVFEVPSRADGPVVPTPLPALGRFNHEAACIDEDTGIVYETEDNGNSGFFRFLPQRRHDLSAGRLQMLAVDGQPNRDLRTGLQVGDGFRTTWVDIDDPDPAGGDGKAVYNQGIAGGGAVFRRLEGTFFDRGDVWFTSTDGGDAHQGQVWRFQPSHRGTGRLELVYESPDSDTLSFPDNLAVSPRGGVLLCEDTSRPPIAQPFSEQYLKGLTSRGQLFDFALNVVDNSEFAGACWSPDGSVLFVNTQGETNAVANPRPSRTYAIWGPWERGAL
ncbi:MAG: alkaline phosphatase PhoX [Acidimicrobiales bacterium]